MNVSESRTKRPGAGAPWPVIEVTGHSHGTRPLPCHAARGSISRASRLFRLTRPVSRPLPVAYDGEGGAVQAELFDGVGDRVVRCQLRDGAGQVAGDRGPALRAGDQGVTGVHRAEDRDAVADQEAVCYCPRRRPVRRRSWRRRGPR